jgi:2-oxoisovalerate dehydrogenase E1 component beta subunit
MARMNMVQALNSAMDVMLGRDPRVVILGEDVGFFGGVFRATDGLQRKHGEHRVLDTPIAEGGIIATAIGMGVNGLKPVAEIQFADYIYPGIDQVVSELANSPRRSPSARRAAAVSVAARRIRRAPRPSSPTYAASRW